MQSEPGRSGHAPVLDALTLEAGESAGYLVRRAQQRHTRLWTSQFGREVTGPQFAIAVAIAMHPGLDQRALGRLASLDKSSTADIVARLRRSGWLNVASSAEDARRKALSLTPLARTALVELTRRASLVQSALLSPLPEAESSTFLRWLQLVAFLGDVPPSTSDVYAPSGGASLPLLTLHTTPGHLLRRTQQVHAMLWAEEVQGSLSSPQYAVLNVLMSYPGGLDQSAVGEQASLDKSNLADVVDRLVGRGLVVQQRHPDDGRRRVLTIADPARATMQELLPAVRRVQRRLLDPLDAADRPTFMRGMRQLAYAR